MSDINAVTNPYDALGVNGSVAGNTGSKNELGQESFMKLMVAEMTHQDPFNPMKNSDVASQFADTATVTGIQNMSLALAQLSASLDSDRMLKAASMLGSEAMVSTSSGYVEAGQGMHGVVNLDGNASNVEVVVTDDIGAQIRRYTLGSHPAGQTEFTWDGLTDRGQTAPSGNYHIKTQATVNGQTVEPEVYLGARVQSVATGSSGRNLILNLQGLGPVSFDNVRELHA